MVKKPFDWPLAMVIVVSVLMLAYGAIALVAQNKPDSVPFDETENQLDKEAWLELYERKKAARKQEQQQDLLRFFEPRPAGNPE